MLTTESRREESLEIKTKEVDMRKLQKAKRRVEKEDLLLKLKKRLDKRRSPVGRERK